MLDLEFLESSNRLDPQMGQSNGSVADHTAAFALHPKSTFDHFNQDSNILDL